MDLEPGSGSPGLAHGEGNGYADGQNDGPSHCHQHTVRLYRQQNPHISSNTIYRMQLAQAEQ